MLEDFFNLNCDSKDFDAQKIREHFDVSDNLHDVTYTPEDFPPELRHCKGYHFRNVGLSKTAFKEMTFTDCDFVDCLFIGADFTGVEFHGCKFTDCNFYKSTFSDCYIDPACFKFDKSYRKSFSNINVYLYQQLLENASQSRQSDFERKADIQFRRWKRWQLDYDLRKEKINKHGYLNRKIGSLIYEWIAGFGYMPERFVLATMFVFTTFSILNMHVLPGTLQYNGETIDEIDFSDAVFFTYSMMTALGFSSIIPVTGFSKIFAVFQALVGIGWLGIFTSLLVKRVLK